jgi:hypothetical protein
MSPPRDVDVPPRQGAESGNARGAAREIVLPRVAPSGVSLRLSRVPAKVGTDNLQAMALWDRRRV